MDPSKINPSYSKCGGKRGRTVDMRTPHRNAPYGVDNSKYPEGFEEYDITWADSKKVWRDVRNRIDYRFPADCT